MPIWPAQPSPAQPDAAQARSGPARRGPMAFVLVSCWHYGLNSEPSTSPRPFFRAGPARGTTAGPMGHLGRVSPRHDEPKRGRRRGRGGRGRGDRCGHRRRRQRSYRRGDGDATTSSPRVEVGPQIRLRGALPTAWRGHGSRRKPQPAGASSSQPYRLHVRGGRGGLRRLHVWRGKDDGRG
jgi:hypothetical protein